MIGPSPAPPDEPGIVDAVDRQRLEATVDGELAGFLEYMVRGDRIALIHTEVLPAFEGRGVAASLVRWALDDARRRGRRVIPSCPYVRRYLERHHEHDDIVIGLQALRDAAFRSAPPGPDGSGPDAPADGGD